MRRKAECGPRRRHPPQQCGPRPSPQVTQRPSPSLPDPPVPSPPGSPETAAPASGPRVLPEPGLRKHISAFFFFLGTHGVPGNLALESAAPDGSVHTWSSLWELLGPGGALSRRPGGGGGAGAAPEKNLVQEKGWPSCFLSLGTMLPIAP